MSALDGRDEIGELLRMVRQVLISASGVQVQPVTRTYYDSLGSGRDTSTLFAIDETL